LAPVDVNGVLAQGTIDSDDDVIDRTAAQCPIAVATLADLITLIRSGDAYVNVHTTANPLGAIRGQLH
jgi:hypothetical protein